MPSFASSRPVFGRNSNDLRRALNYFEIYRFQYVDRFEAYPVVSRRHGKVGTAVGTSSREGRSRDVAPCPTHAASDQPPITVRCTATRPRWSATAAIMAPARRSWAPQRAPAPDRRPGAQPGAAAITGARSPTWCSTATAPASAAWCATLDRRGDHRRPTSSLMHCKPLAHFHRSGSRC